MIYDLCVFIEDSSTYKTCTLQRTAVKQKKRTEIDQAFSLVYLPRRDEYIYTGAGRAQISFGGKNEETRGGWDRNWSKLEEK